MYKNSRNLLDNLYCPKSSRKKGYSKRRKKSWSAWTSRSYSNTRRHMRRKGIVIGSTGVWLPGSCRSKITTNLPNTCPNHFWSQRLRKNSKNRSKKSKLRKFKSTNIARRSFLRCLKKSKSVKANKRKIPVSKIAEVRKASVHLRECASNKNKRSYSN